MLQEATARQERLHFTTIFSTARLWLAYLYLQWQRPDEALYHLEKVLAENSLNQTPGFIMWEGPGLVKPLLQLAVKREVHASFAGSILEKLDKALEPRPVVSNSVSNQDLPVLTSREVEILKLLTTGLSNAQIAKELTISLHTVKSHVAHILSKFAVESRTQAIAIAHEKGLI